MTRKEDIKQSLNVRIARHAEKEGLTLNVLTDIAEDLKQQEEGLVTSAFRTCAIEYSSAVPAEERVDKATLLFGSLDSATSRKEQKQLHTLAAQHQKILTRLLEAKTEADSLRNAANLQTQLASFDRLAEADDYVGAARCIVDAAGSLLQQSTPDESDNEAQMRLEFAERGSGLAKDLASQVDQAIACEMPADSAEVQVSIQRPEKLSAAWLALQILQEADVSLQLLSEKLLQGLLVDNRLPVKADLGSSSTVKWIKAVRQEESDEQTSIHQALKSILDFVGEFGLGNNASLCKKLGQLLWPSIAQVYIQICLRPLTAAPVADLMQLERHCLAAEKFEDDLVELGFLEQSQDLTELLPIHQDTQQLQDSLLRKQKLDLVAKVRDLILLPFHDVETVGLSASELQSEMLKDQLGSANEGSGPNGLGVHSAPSTKQSNGSGARASALLSSMQGRHSNEMDVSLLATGQYQVSRSVLQIVDIIKSALLGAADSESSISAQACRLSMLEIADLFSAIPPVLWHRELQVPVMAALYRNNCHHLSQEILLQPCYYPSLSGEQRLEEVFACVGSLQKCGDAVLNSVAEHQMRELQEILAAAEGFRKIGEAKRGLQARKVIQQLLHTLRQLGSNLRPVLPPGAYVMLGAQLIGSPATSAVASLMRSTDISVEESEDLPRILDPLANESAAAFAGFRGDSQALPAAVSAIESACVPLLRLQAVLEIMRARLGVIRSLWEDGMLAKKGLNATEVISLIRALFVDTDLRDAVIADIQS